MRLALIKISPLQTPPQSGCAAPKALQASQRPGTLSMTRHPAALAWNNVVKDSYLSKYLNYQANLRNGTKQITVYIKYPGKSFVSEGILREGMEEND